MSFCNGWQLTERLGSTESTASKLWACSALKGQLSKPLPPRLRNIVKRGQEDCKCQRLSCYEVVSSRQDGPIRPAQNQVSQIPRHGWRRGSGAERVDGCEGGGKSLVFWRICPAVGLIPTHTQTHVGGHYLEEVWVCGWGGYDSIRKLLILKFILSVWQC